MLNHVVLSTISLTTLTCITAFPLGASAIMRPLSSPNHASIQFNSAQLGDGANSLGGLSITGCSQLGGDGPQVCLQWLGDAITTCLEWGTDASVTACMQRGEREHENEYEYETSNASGKEWEFSLELTIQ